jgi:hypothetical protein
MRVCPKEAPGEASRRRHGWSWEARVEIVFFGKFKVWNKYKGDVVMSEFRFLRNLVSQTWASGEGGASDSDWGLSIISAISSPPVLRFSSEEAFVLWICLCLWAGLVWFMSVCGVCMSVSVSSCMYHVCIRGVMCVRCVVYMCGEYGVWYCVSVSMCVWCVHALYDVCVCVCERYGLHKYCMYGMVCEMCAMCTYGTCDMWHVCAYVGCGVCAVHVQSFKKRKVAGTWCCSEWTKGANERV